MAPGSICSNWKLNVKHKKPNAYSYDNPAVGIWWQLIPTAATWAQPPQPRGCFLTLNRRGMKSIKHVEICILSCRKIAQYSLMVSLCPKISFRKVRIRVWWVSSALIFQNLTSAQPLGNGPTAATAGVFFELQPPRGCLPQGYHNCKNIKRT